MSAYLIARVHVTDPERYKGYAALTPAAIAKYGGRFVVRGGAGHDARRPARERSRRGHRVPVRRARREFWSSPEYAEAKSKRQGAANGQFILVDGYAG
jgi:uncharacterized protein (DUF1330 family)